ncbi:hypothetical protein NADFUDRAFT_44164 [Nadsonia fulvescens var. elongata DSM 6958]|uniref:ZZ-type domain-containing protein n=1 Tax=Nadsonia fulvescens var. elongata DSM 6958 TaxID=857566 RepID=A0A1E3PE80_9ASCO|nr:hypothetical protein NADFUDRAFT_44164 [Nadsonia fulvescens var. elongata DSM 6958]
MSTGMLNPINPVLVAKIEYNGKLLRTHIHNPVDLAPSTLPRVLKTNCNITALDSIKIWRRSKSAADQWVPLVSPSDYEALARSTTVRRKLHFHVQEAHMGDEFVSSRVSRPEPKSSPSSSASAKSPPSSPASANSSGQSETQQPPVATKSLLEDSSTQSWLYDMMDQAVQSGLSAFSNSFDFAETIKDEPWLKEIVNEIVDTRLSKSRPSPLKDIVKADKLETKTTSPEPEDYEVNHNAHCDACLGSITHQRFKCLICPDYDLCADCIPRAGTIHPHTFITIRHPDDIKDFTCVQDTMPTVSHPHVLCDGRGCITNTNCILGVRYKCAVCDDYDLCQNCEALSQLDSKSHGNERHLKDHVMIKIPVPFRSVMCDVQLETEGQTKEEKKPEIEQTQTSETMVTTEEQRLLLDANIQAFREGELITFDLTVSPDYTIPVGAYMSLVDSPHVRSSTVVRATQTTKLVAFIGEDGATNLSESSWVLKSAQEDTLSTVVQAVEKSPFSSAQITFPSETSRPGTPLNMSFPSFAKEFTAGSESSAQTSEETGTSSLSRLSIVTTRAEDSDTSGGGYSSATASITTLPHPLGHHDFKDETLMPTKTTESTFNYIGESEDDSTDDYDVISNDDYSDY